MFYEFANSQFGFWVLAMLIATADSAIPLRAGQFLFTLSKTNEISVRASPRPFLLREREVVLTLISYFQQPYYLSSIYAARTDEASSSRGLSCDSKDLRPLFAFSLVCFALTLLGPIVSMAWDLETSLVTILPLLYLNSISAIIFLYRSTASRENAARKYLQISFELMVCPFLAMNLFKKVRFTGKATVNVWDIVGDSATAERVTENLRAFDLAEIDIERR